MGTYQERVIAEQADLQAKIDKLEAFIEGDLFKGISPNEQSLLCAQSVHMKNYNNVLQTRIKGFSRVPLA